MIKSTKSLLLAGASALAILASAAEANAETFVFTGAVQTFTASVSGEYAVELLGASGGNAHNAAIGGLGAEVSGDVFLTAGEDLTLFVGGDGGSGLTGGGGGGSFVFHGTDVLAVAGGGGGGAGGDEAGPGLAGTSGGTGGGSAGGIGGAGGTGGGAGAGVGLDGGGFGGGGAGVNTGPAGYGNDSLNPGGAGGFGGKFPNGGASAYGGGGFGGGGGSGIFGGGGGSGFSGGGGGGPTGDGRRVGGGGGGGSYLASLFTDPVLTAGVNSGDGSISITQVPGGTVPESSTWAMMLMGFAGLGWLAHARRRKTSPA